ncbi:CheR family methyltransferase [Ramlibacter humi]|uniref:Chemotaxis protein methyltransferase n=1 Tax=Ramlibacter humi TaxID=2530451 RepID=A0A4Z0BAV7_9BURK|nr:CheR family methyltransferase [Ramlibacter humi]TFY96192.1 chemotaxis protein CheR [Ramlibacter humi]
MSVPGEALLGQADFELACRLIGDYAGIRISPHKRQMVHNRLSRRLRVLGLDSFGDYLDLVQNDPVGEREAFVNALTTNLTAFFREPHHFELLRERAIQHRQTQAEPMRVWCSACSTGEEAWSIALTLREAGCPAEVLATDIDTDALDRAEAGLYPMERVNGLPPERLRGLFLKGYGDNEGWVSIRPELRPMVTFGQLNLLAPAWPEFGPLDAIFCRNVVIYFDRESQKRLLGRFAQRMHPGGLLAVGHAESFPAGQQAFRACGRTAYEYTGQAVR